MERRNTTHRTTFSFTSDSGQLYLYDDGSGTIFPWSCAREAALEAYLDGSIGGTPAALKGRFGAEEAGAAIRFVTHWAEKYGAFTRMVAPPEADTASVDVLEANARQSCRQLILVLTEDCNLRCGYCAFSELYPNTRSYSTRRMEPEMSKRALDWFVEFVRPHLLRAGRRQAIGLSFYGGEPLINAWTLKASLEYARDRHPGVFTPVLTTNGTLLKGAVADLLVEHRVGLSISIDGPPSEHNRHRRDRAGIGTFDTVLKNLYQLRKKHPEYCAQYVSAICVYDWKTDLDRVREFFKEHRELFPLGVRVSAVTNTYDGTYYDRFTDAEREAHCESVKRLWRNYVRSLALKRETDIFVDSFFGSWLLLVYGRPRAQDKRPSIMPYTGACIPGSKVAVQVDGTLLACERVSGTFPLGHLDRGGFDWERVQDMLRRYRAVFRRCNSCHVSKLCQLCFAHIEGYGGFHDPTRACMVAARTSEEVLTRYVSILESNPRAHCGGCLTELSGLSQI